MSKIRWELIDEQFFVYLVADLLRELGFTAIQYQGDGPDGGLDLFCTELMSLGLQDHQPFKWGIQCKFSIGGKRRSVSDAEIRDVEGILRSDRYLSQDLRGYMLVTNRRIAQNVLERLRGIDRSSPFRTSAIDGTRLELLLADCQDLIEKYFDRLQATLSQLGAPTLVGTPDTTHSPPVPIVQVRLRAPYQEGPANTVSAIFDPGAEMTVVPGEAVAELPPTPSSFVAVEDFRGKVTLMKMCLLSVEIGDVDIGTVSVLIGASSGHALIGRNILKHLVVLWDGPNDSLQVWVKKQGNEA